METRIEEKVKPAIVFLDVYETILDLSELEKKVNAVYNDRNSYHIWFNMFMQYCFVDNCIDQFNDFRTIAGATMHMTAQILGRPIGQPDVDYILELMKHLPIRPGVEEGLSILNDGGLPVVALSNASLQIVTERMERTGLISYFRKVLSAEAIGKYKPYIEVYRWALREMQVEAGNALLVSSHGWDIAGASNVGMQTAYLMPFKEVLYPLAPLPNYKCKDLCELAKILCS